MILLKGSRDWKARTGRSGKQKDNGENEDKGDF